MASERGDRRVRGAAKNKKQENQKGNLKWQKKMKRPW